MATTFCGVAKAIPLFAVFFSFRFFGYFVNSLISLFSEQTVSPLCIFVYELPAAVLYLRYLAVSVSSLCFYSEAVSLDRTVSCLSFS